MITCISNLFVASIMFWRLLDQSLPQASFLFLELVIVIDFKENPSLSTNLQQKLTPKIILHHNRRRTRRRGPRFIRHITSPPSRLIRLIRTRRPAWHIYPIKKLNRFQQLPIPHRCCSGGIIAPVDDSRPLILLHNQPCIQRR